MEKVTENNDSTTAIDITVYNEFDLIEVLDRICLFTHERVDKDTVPDELFVAECRHGDDEGILETVEPFVAVNFYGTLICKEDFNFLKDNPQDCYYEVGRENYDFKGVVISLDDYLSDDFMESLE